MSCFCEWWILCLQSFYKICWCLHLQKFGHALDVIAKLLQGEKDLETYLLENPPSEVNVQTAKEKLVAAERNLRYVFNRCPKEKVVYIVRYWAVAWYFSWLTLFADLAQCIVEIRSGWLTSRNSRLCLQICTNLPKFYNWFDA